MITGDQRQVLLDLAQKVSQNSYSPYSKFSVGAAVLCEDGSTYVGTNVENASYGLTICAEQAAIACAIASGKKGLTAIAVWGGQQGVMPCGACRQFIAEFGKDIEVIYYRKGQVQSCLIIDLMPDAFSGKDINE